MASNLRGGKGEIDLLVTIGGRIVAVEVKTRVGEDPLIQLTRDKERSMWEAANRLRPRPGRIDVVAVRLDRAGATVHWIQDVV